MLVRKEGRILPVTALGRVVIVKIIAIAYERRTPSQKLAHGRIVIWFFSRKLKMELNMLTMFGGGANILHRSSKLSNATYVRWRWKRGH